MKIKKIVCAVLIFQHTLQSSLLELVVRVNHHTFDDGAPAPQGNSVHSQEGTKSLNCDERGSSTPT